MVLFEIDHFTGMVMTTIQLWWLKWWIMRSWNTVIMESVCDRDQLGPAWSVKEWEMTQDTFMTLMTTYWYQQSKLHHNPAMDRKLTSLITIGFDSCNIIRNRMLTQNTVHLGYKESCMRSDMSQIYWNHAEFHNRWNSLFHNSSI